MSDDIVREFLVESSENLDLLDRELINLEKDPGNRATLASIFRTIHTIKGTCGFLGFTKLESVAHVGENLLSKLRDGELALNPEMTTALLTMVDAIRQMLASVEAIGNEGERNDQELIQILTRLLQGSAAAAKTEAKAEPPATLVAATLTESAPPAPVAPVPEATVAAPLVETPVAVTPVPLAEAAPKVEAKPEPHPEHAADHGPAPAADSGGQSQSRTAASESSIRVDVTLLDKLMNLVGELVLARNQILQFSNATEDAGLLAPSQRLNLITTELQEGVMKTRMQPIGNIWSKFPRTVRDVATMCGKQVRIEMEGKETELDKTIVEAIKDPLTHIVRNSVDHGIEKPERRVAVGKPAEGRLLLRAFHEGGQVIIEISDDGGGLDGDRIRRKAVEKGLITPEQAARMGEREGVNLIFLPGFSTAEKVTNVSGRGVGMDVVKTNIEKIGGTVDVQSKPGTGTTVRMKIPLTLAIIPALIVTSGGDRYAIPQISLLELVRLDGEDAQKGIELIQGVPVHRLRGRLLPLVYLNRELKVEDKAPDLSKLPAVNIVVLQADERQFGLVVDEINDTEEIVVKPLGKQLKGIKTFAGSTIMGDGRVALILDVLGVAQTSNVVSESRERALSDKDKHVASTGGERQTMLLFQCGPDGRMAMDLSLVARLEEFKPEMVECAGDAQVVQYRGQIMPLLRVSDLLLGGNGNGHGSGKRDLTTTLQVVVYSEQGRSVGLVVDRILDIVEEAIVPQQPSKREGLLGSAVIQQRVTDLLDVRGFVRTANPDFFEPALAAAER
ncbi:MAG TPA: chemotaxis protein CheA [Candidatus Acidoferrum sp.]|nr:chemotaxis protein CheA [Candidatus Acidoferrum sp.]